MSSPLTPSDIDLAIKELPEWSVEEDRLTRELKFASFRQATSFLVRLSFEAEELNHHPEIYCVYNRMVLGLTTHDAGNKISKRDVLLAHKINQILKEFTPLTA